MNTCFFSRAALAVPVTLALLIALAGCGTAPSDQSDALTTTASAQATGAETSTAQESSTTPGETLTDVWRLAVGDCYHSDDYTADAVEIPVVACTEPHDREVFYSAQLEGTDYPGEDQVTSQAEDICTGDVFTSFVGVSYAQSDLYVYYLYPTSDTWDQLGDREVLCTVGSDTEETASLAASNR